jgi:hypothetical protein
VRCITNEPPRRRPTGAGARLISLFAKADLATNLTGRGESQKTRTRGEGVFVRAGYSSRPDRERKTQNPAPPRNHAAAADPPLRFRLPTPAEKAQRVDALRAALAGSAPAFLARACHDREGQR